MAVAATVAGALLLGSPASAQVPLADRAVYPASFYAPFAPQTAYDIVARTPGFVLDAGEEVRGFGGAAGNVLIDGGRPSSKSGGIEDALKRIPAAQVERVEVIRAAQTAEAQGQALVLNVVRRSGRGGGTWKLEVERNGSGLFYPRAEAGYARAVGGWDTSIKVNALWEQYPYRTLRRNRDATGDLVSSWIDNRPTTLAESYVSGDAKRLLWGGALTVNGRFGWQKFYYNLFSEIYLARLPSGLPDQTNLFEYEREDWTLELGGDYARRFGPWTWKLIGLANGKTYDQEQSDARFLAAGPRVSSSDLRLAQKPLEVIGRTTLAWNKSGVFRPEYGVEVAYNRLNSALSLTVDNGAGPRPINLPAAAIVAEELRAEAFANGAWTVTPHLTLEGGAAVETSEITVTGDASSRQRFTFLKPHAAAVYRLRPSTQVRLGLRRTVGQLDFTDFAASAELQDAETVAGNPNLGPDQATRLSTSIDHRAANGLAVNLELYREWRSDVLEYVLLPSGAAGIANAGDAVVDGAKLTLDAPLHAILTGATLKVSAEVIESEFEDPLTGQVRALTDLRSPTINAEFRHDVPEQGWSWGLTYASGSDDATYLVDQVDFNRYSARVGGYVETSRWRGVRARLFVRSAATERYYRLRTFHRRDRGGPVIGTDERESVRGAFLNLTLNGSF